MSELLQRLRAGVVSEPWSDEPRLILADALEEADEPTEAAAWRVFDKTKLTGLPFRVENLLPQILDYWVSVGLATGPCDRDAAQQAVHDAYRVAGLEPPSLTLWLDSPLAGAIGAELISQLQVGDLVRDRVRNQVLNMVCDQVWDQVRNQVRDQVMNTVRDRVWSLGWNRVRGSIRTSAVAGVRDQTQSMEQFWEQVWYLLWKQLRDPGWSQFRAQFWNKVSSLDENQVVSMVANQVDRCGYGQQDAHWLSFYATFDLAGLSVCRSLRPLMRLATCCGCWWPFHDAVILTERPVELINVNGVRHVRYSDGFTTFKGDNSDENS